MDAGVGGEGAEAHGTPSEGEQSCCSALRAGGEELLLEGGWRAEVWRLPAGS